MRAPAAALAAAIVFALSIAGCSTRVTGGLDQLSRVKVRIEDDQFERVTRIVGPSVSERGATHFLRSFVLSGRSPTSHQFYVIDRYGGDWKFWRRAAAPGYPLEFTEISRDVGSCRNGCTLTESFAAEIPDSLLRASRDSLAVKFYAKSGDQMVLVLRPVQIAAQLAAVDSVVAAQRKP